MSPTDTTTQACTAQQLSIKTRRSTAELHFYHAMLHVCIAQTMPSLDVCLSARLSVCHMPIYYMEMTKHIIKLSSPWAENFTLATVGPKASAIEADRISATASFLPLQM